MPVFVSEESRAKRKNGRGGKIPHHLSSIRGFSEVRDISIISINTLFNSVRLTAKIDA
ncbi:hypothetical protein VPHD480_0430 [Vibrio phage D480]